MRHINECGNSFISHEGVMRNGLGGKDPAMLAEIKYQKMGRLTHDLFVLLRVVQSLKGKNKTQLS